MAAFQKVLKVGIELSVAGNALGAVNTLAKALSGLNNNILTANGNLSKLVQGAAGGALAAAGLGLMKGAWAMANAAEKLAEARYNLMAAGASKGQTDAATGQGWRSALAIPGTSVNAAVDMQTFLRGRFGDMNEASNPRILNPMLSAVRLLQHIPGKERTQEEALHDLEQHISVIEQAGWAAEMRGGKATGKIDPNRLSYFVNRAVAAEQFSSGKLDGGAMAQAIGTGGAAFRRMSDKGFLDAIPIMMETGGNRFGTMLATSTQNLFAGQMQRAELALLSSGSNPLINMSHVVGVATGIGHGSSGGRRTQGSADYGDDYSSSARFGHRRARRSSGGAGDIPKTFRFETGALKDEDLFQANKFMWTQNDLIPWLKSKTGGSDDANTWMDYVQRTKMPRNASKFFMDLLTGWQQGTVMRASGLVGDTSLQFQSDEMGRPVLDKNGNKVVNKNYRSLGKRMGILNDTSVSAQRENLGEAWGNLKQSLGQSVIVIGFLKALTAGINGLAGFFVKHPNIGKTLVYAGAGLGVIFAALGGALVVGAVAGLASFVLAMTPLTVSVGAIAGLIVGATVAFVGLVGVLVKLPDILHGIADWFHGIFNHGAPQPTAPPAPPPPTTLHATIPVHVGAKQIANHVATVQARALSRPPVAAPGHNSSMSYAPAGVTLPQR